MADEPKNQTETEPTEPATDPTPAQEPKEPEIDWKAESRKWESRAKENKGAADELARLKEAEKSEFEREHDAREKAEGELRQLRHERDVAQWAADVSKDTGVPASVLRGDTLEELQSHAQQIKGSMPVYPVVPEGNGKPPTVTKQQILSMADERERKAAIAAHLDLFAAK